MFNSDVLVIGIVFLLLVGSLFFYLYMYVQQVDQKASLLESILLDMKVSHEITSFSSNNESPASSSAQSSAQSSSNSDEQEKPYVPYSDDKAADDKADEAVLLDSEELKPFQPADELEELDAEELHDTNSPLEPLVNYDTMSLKELQSLAKAKGISGTMKKNQLIETLKGLEQSGLKHGVVGSSFLENSALVSNDV